MNVELSVGAQRGVGLHGSPDYSWCLETQR